MSTRVDPLLPGLGRWPLAASVAKGLVGAAVAFALVVALSGCRAVAPDADLPPPPTDAAEGAAAPPGLADIRKGMSQREVLRILRPYHEVLHAADASPAAPLVDYFVYVEDEQ